MKFSVKPSILILSLVLAACGTKTHNNGATALELTSVEPANVKANYSGDLTLHGTGFSETSMVLIDGQPAWALPGVTSALVDENTLTVHVAFQGAGHELSVGNRQVQVVDPARQSNEQTLHVRTILSKVDHLRTLPGAFVRDGGYLDIWMSPKDLAGTFLAPGHELAGTAGLDDSNFQWKNVSATRLGTTAGRVPEIAGVADVVFEPVGTVKPLAVALTIDQSGSMIGAAHSVASDPTDERLTQSEAFITRFGDTDQAEVLRFQGGAGNVFTVTPLTSDKNALKAGLESMRTTEAGDTPLFDAMIRSVADIKAVTGSVTKAAIVVTDGRDNTSTHGEAAVIAAARDAGIPIFVVGLGNPNDPRSLDQDSLQRIADQTGGRLFYAEDPSALAGIFDELTAILAASYRLECAVSFNPPLATTGTWTVQGDVMTTVDGEEITIPMPSFNVSVLN